MTSQSTILPMVSLVGQKMALLRINNYINKEREKIPTFPQISSNDHSIPKLLPPRLLLEYKQNVHNNTPNINHSINCVDAHKKRAPLVLLNHNVSQYVPPPVVPKLLSPQFLVEYKRKQFKQQQLFIHEMHQQHIHEMLQQQRKHDEASPESSKQTDSPRKVMRKVDSPRKSPRKTDYPRKSPRKVDSSHKSAQRGNEVNGIVEDEENDGTYGKQITDDRYENMVRSYKLQFEFIFSSLSIIIMESTLISHITLGF